MTGRPLCRGRHRQTGAGTTTVTGDTDIAYYSVIRGGPVGAGDELVPANSQDLNQVPVLRGRVKVLVTPTGHRLVAQDGILIADILAGMN